MTGKSGTMQSGLKDLLDIHHLRKTEMRLQVLQLFVDAGVNALSSKDIEDALGNADRITLYRTLKTFEQKGLIHLAVDTTGKTKYALCAEMCSEHAHHDEHAHFHCERCDTTICLDDSYLPKVAVPRGFKVDHAYLVLEGTCDKCLATP